MRRARLVVLGVVTSIILGAILFGVERRGLEHRGWGCLLPSSPPYQHAGQTLDHVGRFYRKNRGTLGSKWPAPEVLAAHIPEIIVPDQQPYRSFGIYVLKSKKTKQGFLYAPENPVPPSKADTIEHELWTKRKVWIVPVTACVMATRQDASGTYVPYHDYPSAFKKSIPSEAWTTWKVLMEDDLTYFVQSDVPPIPGCFAHLDAEQKHLSKFYYPEQVLPVLRAVYPKASVPEDQVLREGRDY